MKTFLMIKQYQIKLYSLLNDYVNIISKEEDLLVNSLVFYYSIIIKGRKLW